MASFTFATGSVGSFGTERFALRGGPPTRHFDGLAAGGTAVSTHRYSGTSGTPLGSSAVVMNKSSSLRWNTIVCGFPWFDINDPYAPVPLPGNPYVTDPPGQPERTLTSKILAGVLPAGCVRGPNPTDDDDPRLPLVTALHPNVPNPFNPTTRISFDLAVAGRTRLQIFNVAGALVRSLVDADLPAGARQILWDGRNGAGIPVSSGVYFMRLDAPDQTFTRKSVLLR